MHLKRWITAIVAVPVLATLIYKGPPVGFACLIAVIAVLAISEYFFIVSDGDKIRILKPIPLIGTAAGLGMIAAALHAFFEAMILLMFSGFLLGALFSMPVYRSVPNIMETVTRQAQGLVYVFLPLAMLVLIRARPDGVTWIFFIVIIVFIGDAGAFYAGTYLGKHKLAPAISPSKSVEGSLGGLTANILVAIVFKTLLLPGLSTAFTVVFAVALGIAGQIGDLFESELKRRAGIKDSGDILPGHGGMLDRIDALLFAVPVAYGFKLFIF
ncbi:MAG: phosphatidate cytidylyltransferase [Desulfobacteraceae bacterium]|nr:phosphatidate cytidylyltransferase [Desulfobacteraceae bacterium]